MKLQTLSLILLSAIVATASAIFLHQHLPQKQIFAIPSSDKTSYLYLSKPADSNTRVAWIDQSTHSWRCEVAEQDTYLNCSFALFLTTDPDHGWDLTDYSHMNIKMNYSGDARKVRVSLRTFDSRFSSEEDANSAKYHSTVLRPDDFNKRVSISLTEFTVADWWLDQFDLKRQLARPDLGNVMQVGVEFVEALSVGNHDVTLEEISFSGKLISAEDLYLSILGLWVLTSLILLTVRVLLLRREARSAFQRINELSDTNSRLLSEKDRLRVLSHVDALTGAYNRYAIDKTLEQLAQDPRQQNLALILIDIDHFKRINDRRGHTVGDQVLKQLATLVMSNIRNEDIFGRWGGEEFILLCPNTTSDNAFIFAEKLRGLISDTQFAEEKPLAVTASFGVGAIQAGEDFIAAFQRVDAALYQAKSTGRNCVIRAD